LGAPPADYSKKPDLDISSPPELVYLCTSGAHPDRKFQRTFQSILTGFNAEQYELIPMKALREAIFSIMARAQTKSRDHCGNVGI
jgi:hypothetical protein